MFIHVSAILKGLILNCACTGMQRKVSADHICFICRQALSSWCFTVNSVPTPMLKSLYTFDTRQRTNFCLLGLLIHVDFGRINCSGYPLLTKEMFHDVGSYGKVHLLFSSNYNPTITEFSRDASWLCSSFLQNVDCGYPQSRLTFPRSAPISQHRNTVELAKQDSTCPGLHHLHFVNFSILWI